MLGEREVGIQDPAVWCGQGEAGEGGLTKTKQKCHTVRILSICFVCHAVFVNIKILFLVMKSRL